VLEDTAKRRSSGTRGKKKKVGILLFGRKGREARPAVRGARNRAGSMPGGKGEERGIYLRRGVLGGNPREIQRYWLMGGRGERGKKGRSSSQLGGRSVILERAHVVEPAKRGKGEVLVGEKGI